MQTKKCTQCGKVLTIDNFYIKHRLPTLKYQSACKACRIKQSSDYHKRPERKVYAKQYYQNNKEQILKRQRTYYQDNKDHVKEIKDSWLLRNPERRKETTRKHNKNLKDTFLRMYGGKCVCCGETAWEFLTIEHKLGQVGINRKNKETGKFAYAKAVKEYRPDLYEILCWNCNCSKGRYGYCPHQKN